MNKKLIIIDGHALLHRAWHALPPLTAKDGTVVSGAYGFVMILLKAIKELKPTHVAVTFDLAGPTFRHVEYEEYKATREKKPDELYAQVPIIREILDAMRIPAYSVQGFEADDVIGTIAHKVTADNTDIEVIIVTGDKDTLQLVNNRVKVYTLRKGMTDTVLYDEAGVQEKMGIRPDQLIDYKALRGDPSDNIPGVKGVGEKTAVELLQKYGSIKSLYEALESGKSEDIKESMRKKLVDGKKDALLAQDLCRIRQDVEFDFNFDEAKYQPVRQDMVRDIFERYQFLKLLSQLPEGGTQGVLLEAGHNQSVRIEPTPVLATDIPETAQIVPDLVSDTVEARRHLLRLTKAKRIAFRTVVHDGKHVGRRIRWLAVCDGTGAIVFSGDALNGAREELIKLFGDSERVTVCHDLKREYGTLTDFGIEFKCRPFDLMIASYLLSAGERRHSIEAILSYHRNVIPPFKGEDDDSSALRRLITELSHFLSLADEFGVGLGEQGLEKLNTKMELPLAIVLSRMERVGVRVDVDYLAKLSTELGKKLRDLTVEIYAIAGQEFNINSPMQLKEILFDKLGVPAEGLKKTEKGKTLSTAASELEKLRGAHEIVGKILDYRELMKLTSTYVDALPPLVEQSTGRIHADFNQTVTATGRLSSSNPNMQNIPTAGSEYGKKVRDAFMSERGYVLLAADYSQIELRIAAHIAGEKHMVESFRRGEDIHWRTAAEMFGEENAVARRRIAKAINFGILYGMGPTRLSASAEISFAEAKDYIERYFSLHRGIADYIERTKEQVAERGYVETLFGRKRFFPNFHLLNQRERAEAERQAVNMPIQGTSADMIKMAMVTLDREIGERYGRAADAPVRMILQVHDELVFEVRKDLLDEWVPEVKKHMEGVVKLSVPIVVGVAIGKRWGTMEKV